MKKVKPGMMEYQIEALFQFESYHNGGCRFDGELGLLIVLVTILTLAFVLLDTMGLLFTMDMPELQTVVKLMMVRWSSWIWELSIIAMDQISLEATQ